MRWHYICILWSAFLMSTFKVMGIGRFLGCKVKMALLPSFVVWEKVKKNNPSKWLDEVVVAENVVEHLHFDTRGKLGRHSLLMVRFESGDFLPFDCWVVGVIPHPVSEQSPFWAALRTDNSISSHSHPPSLEVSRFHLKKEKGKRNCSKLWAKTNKNSGEPP